MGKGKRKKSPPNLPVVAPVLLAVRRRDLPALEALLRAPSPQLESHGLSALQVAALGDVVEAVPLLLDAGADVNRAPKFDFHSHQEAVQQLQLTGWECRALEWISDGRRGPGAIRMQLLRQGLGQRKRASPPLAVAVGAGSAAVAQRLVAAGASRRHAWGQLLTLATEGSCERRVQQMAEVLLQGGPASSLPSGPTACEAHLAAAKLAYLEPSRRGRGCRCPWLLLHLLQLHQGGGPLASPSYAPAAALVAAQPGIHSDASASASWLAVPALAAAPAALLLLARQFAAEGNASVLAAMLAGCPAAAALLQQELAAAEEGAAPDGGGDSSWVVPAVTQAALGGSAELLDALLPPGTQPSIHLVNSILDAAAKDDRSADATIAALRLLFRRVPPPPVPLDRARLGSCPIYRLFELRQLKGQQRLLSDCWHYRYYDAIHWAKASEGYHYDDLRLMEFLVEEGGYRPVTYRSMLADRGQLLHNFNPFTSPGPPAGQLSLSWGLNSSSRWLRLAASGGTWDPENHAAYPIGFRFATRALLLAANRGAAVAAATGSGSGTAPLGAAGAAGLARLPQPLMMRVIGLAAYPLSAWQPTEEYDEECLEDYGWLEPEGWRWR